jgi:hypothetical protein
MKTLKKEFRKNGLDYTLIKRTDKIVLFQLGPSSDPDGYEVCRIYIMRPHRAFGVYFEESEVLSSNDQFLSDGSYHVNSGCFHSQHIRMVLISVRIFYVQ